MGSLIVSGEGGSAIFSPSGRGLPWCRFSYSLGGGSCSSMPGVYKISAPSSAA